MSYSASKIECVRFAGRHPAEGIGCCAIDLFQGFINDPDAKAKVGLTHGDSLSPLILQREFKSLGQAHYGPTNKDIFLSYLRTGTFDMSETPNRAFLVAITQNQINYYENARKWLAILKENGFEFVRAIDNSVYSGSAVSRDTPRMDSTDKVYIFGLFRNIGSRRVLDPFLPPKEWLDLPQAEDDFTIWEKNGLYVLTKEEAETGVFEKAVALRQGAAEEEFEEDEYDPDWEEEAAAV